MCCEVIKGYEYKVVVTVARCTYIDGVAVQCIEVIARRIMGYKYRVVVAVACRTHRWGGRAMHRQCSDHTLHIQTAVQCIQCIYCSHRRQCNA